MTTPSEYRNQGTHKPRGDVSGTPDHDDTTVGDPQAGRNLEPQRPTGLRHSCARSSARTTATNPTPPGRFRRSAQLLR